MDCNYASCIHPSELATQSSSCKFQVLECSTTEAVSVVPLLELNFNRRTPFFLAGSFGPRPRVIFANWKVPHRAAKNGKTPLLTIMTWHTQEPANQPFLVVVVQGDGRLCVSLHQQYLIKELVELPTGETDVAYFPPQFLQVHSGAGALVFFARTRINCILSIK